MKELLSIAMHTLILIAGLIGKAVGWVVVRVILVLIFFCVFMPIGLIMRLFGNDPLRRKYDPVVDTYRCPSSERELDHMDKSF